jgi:hypothetical protein
MPHASDPKVIPNMRGRLVLVAEHYGTPRVLVTSAVRQLGCPAKAFATGTDTLAFLKLHPGAPSSASWPISACRTWMEGSSPNERGTLCRRSAWC